MCLFCQHHLHPADLSCLWHPWHLFCLCSLSVLLCLFYQHHLHLEDLSCLWHLLRLLHLLHLYNLFQQDPSYLSPQ